MLQGQVEDGLISRIVVACDYHVSAGGNPITVQVLPHGAGQHDAGPVVVREDQSLLDGASGQQDVFRAHGPETFPPCGAFARLQQSGDVVVVITGDCGTRQQHDVGQTAKLIHGVLCPVMPGFTFDTDLFPVQDAAEGFILFDQHHPCTCPARGQSGHQSGGTTAANQQITVGIDLFVVIRIGPCERPAQTGGFPDGALPDAPVGPFEGLVIKTGRPEYVCVIEQAAHIEIHGGPAVLAVRHQSLCERNRRCTGGGHTGVAFADLKQCAGFLFTSGENTSRAVIFEAAADDLDAVCEQG